MSSFKDELLKSVAPKVDITQSVHKKIDECINAMFNSYIETNYKNISNEILQKAQSSSYEEFGGKKNIRGCIRLASGGVGYRTDGFWPTTSTFPNPPYVIAEKYMEKFPNISMALETPDSDCIIDRSSWYRFSCELVNKIQHCTWFLGSVYHTYHCTDAAKKIIEGIKKKAAMDNIQVEFSHIELETGGLIRHTHLIRSDTYEKVSNKKIHQ